MDREKARQTKADLKKAREKAQQEKADLKKAIIKKFLENVGDNFNQGNFVKWEEYYYPRWESYPKLLKLVDYYVNLGRQKWVWSGIGEMPSTYKTSQEYRKDLERKAGKEVIRYVNSDQFRRDQDKLENDRNKRRLEIKQAAARKEQQRLQAAARKEQQRLEQERELQRRNDIIEDDNFRWEVGGTNRLGAPTGSLQDALEMFKTITADMFTKRNPVFRIILPLGEHETGFTVKSDDEEVTTIGNGDYRGLELPGTWDRLYIVTPELDVKYEKGHYIVQVKSDVKDSAFSECRRLEYVYFTKNVRKIGEYAFQDTSIKSLDLSKLKLETIPEGAFKNCKQLKLIKFPIRELMSSYKGLTEIEDEAFASCTLLDNIKLPNELKTIGDYAFFECRSLKIIYWNYYLETVGVGAFEQTAIDLDGLQRHLRSRPSASGASGSGASGSATSKFIYWNEADEPLSRKRKLNDLDDKEAKKFRDMYAQNLGDSMVWEDDDDDEKNDPFSKGARGDWDTSGGGAAGGPTMLNKFIQLRF